ncbi:hypothetical protein PSTT_07333 [Puccinia striiformis]|uniref:DASH complex subunit DAM1 n=1 Tax=Puccinia striiformis TaxID=27350 RepID=A0A2S4VGQ5_9BASI|nr:hypothetical protein PSTT_07333 [Puccinia striiformis]
MNEPPRLKAPKTPLKRVSRNSLRTSTLSGSYPPPSSEPRHTPMVELEDAQADLHINLSNLDLVCLDLDGFNEAFSAFIYGLRVNSYVTDFDEAPKLQSFRDAHARKEAERVQQALEQAQQEARRLIEESQSKQKLVPSFALSQKNPPSVLIYSNSYQEESFATNEHSMITRSANQASTSSNNTNNQRGGNNKASCSSSTTTSKITGATKPKNFSQATKTQQKQLLKFTEKIMINLPLKFREQQPHRHEMEIVISLLKLHPNGLFIKDIVKLEPTLVMHRARECATALVAAKKAVKINKDGLLYKLLAD